MAVKEIEFFNVGEVESIPGLGEQCLTRIPQAVRCQLNQRARITGMDSVGCELRLVSDAPDIDVYLTALAPSLGTAREVRGINMRGCYEPEEFEERTGYAIRRFGATGKPVLAINLFPNSCTPGFALDENTQECRRERVFNQMVGRLAQNCRADNLHFVPGSAILDDFSGLSSDLLHPCAYGHAVMAANLAREIKRIMGLA